MSNRSYTNTRPYEAPKPKIKSKKRFITSISIVLLLVISLIWVGVKALQPAPIGPAFTNGASYPFSFPFEAGQKDAFVRNASMLDKADSLYVKANIGLHIVSTVLLPPGAFDPQNSYAFSWEGYRFVPAVIVPPDARVVSAYRTSLTDAEPQTFTAAGAQVIMLGLSEEQPLLDADTRFAQISGLYYWTSSNLDTQNSTGSDIPVVLVGAAEAIGETRVVSPMTSSVPNGLLVKRAQVNFTFTRVEFARDQVRVLINMENESGEPLSWSLDESNTYLVADDAEVPRKPARGGVRAEDELGESVPRAKSSKYLIFDQITTPKTLTLTVPDPGGDGSLTVEFDMSKLKKTGKAGTT